MEESEAYLCGVAMGILIVIVFLLVFHPEPFFVDCGCGATTSMMSQCIQGGNLSAPICGAFK